MARREDVPVGRVALGKAAGQAVNVYGFTAGEMGVPLVEICGALEYLEHLTVEQADALADGLKRAARIARGEELAPNPLNEFLGKGRAKL